MFIEPGDRVRVEDLLLGLIVQSGNDAAVALAEHVAGSEAGFADLMNQAAVKMGLKNTHFVNSTGFPILTTLVRLTILVKSHVRSFRSSPSTTVSMPFRNLPGMT